MHGNYNAVFSFRTVGSIVAKGANVEAIPCSSRATDNKISHIGGELLHNSKSNASFCRIFVSKRVKASSLEFTLG